MVWATLSRYIDVYRCEAKTIEGFVQQLSVCYVGRGYWFYVSGFIPTVKQPRRVDEKLISLYGTELAKATRARRKQAGIASVQYLRFRHFFVLLATQGRHRFFEDHGERVRDVRRKPIVVSGYSVGLTRGRPNVRIAEEEYRNLKAYFADLAIRRSAEHIEGELSRLPFEPYAPVRRQYLALLRVINRTRKLAGLSQVAPSCLRMRRRICRPFESASDGEGLIRTGTG